MNQQPGTFIIIEGTDGSGKGTQFKLLSEHLSVLGYEIATFDFPQYDLPSSYFVKEYLNGKYGSAEDVGPYTASLFYALDRFEAGPKIRQALSEGKIVLCNRFVGSSMAHQGTKLLNTEERRGFFIWLDNLEFEVLKLPRPTISFVLRVPAQIAQRLVDKKEKRSYTDKKRDIHEADINHLKRSVEVYDDLTQLFPKDFQRIDCVRDGKLLDVAAVQRLLWEKVAALLPPVPKNRPKPVKATPVSTAPGPAKPIEPAPQAATPAIKPVTDRTLVIDNVSVLFRQALSTALGRPFAEKAPAYTAKNAKGTYDYYIPPQLELAVAAQYTAQMDRLFEQYAALHMELRKHLGGSPEATDTATRLLTPVIPLAAKAHVSTAFDTAGALQTLARALADQALPEAQTIGQKLLTELGKTGRKQSKKQPAAAASPSSMQKLASSYLSDTYATEAPSVRLASVWPRNEFDVVPEMLYAYGNVSLQDLRSDISTWPYERKSNVFTAYLRQWSPKGQPDSALSNIHYSFELLCDVQTVRQIQDLHVAPDLEIQALNPRFGYATPPAVEAAGLSDQYDDCFDASLQLYSFLQSSGHQAEAPYALLQGHKVRSKLNCTAAQLLQIVAALGEQHQITTDIQANLADTHPLLASFVEHIARISRPQNTSTPN